MENRPEWVRGLSWLIISGGSMDNPIIEVKNVGMVFPGVVALSDVSFDVYPGEVHVLVGENGAGKSTLIKILLGAYLPTQGQIFFDTREICFKTPFDASRVGIEGVHQELMLVPWLSVKQNIFLNREIKFDKFHAINLKKMKESGSKLLSDFGVNIDVDRPVKNYAPSIWKMIDIVRVINLNPRVVIFDEPTAILTDREVSSLFQKILELKSRGIGIIYISHRLEEIRKIADRVTILRDGHKIGTRIVTEVSDDEIVKMMVGRDVSSYYSRNIVPQREELVSFKNVNLQKGQKNLNLSIHKGEIVGLAGLVGSGRTEIAEAMMGINKILSGTMYYKGQNCCPRSPSQMINLGVVLVPENRKYLGLILGFSVAANIVLCIMRLMGKFFYNLKKEKACADDMIEKLSIKTPSRNQLMSNLSGGNQQKVVIAKSLLVDSDFLILDEPTVGVDVGAKEEIHTLMDRLAGEGKGILMISSDLPEIIGMCDRVYVMYEGRIVKYFTRSELSEENVAAYMLGTKGS
jgi:ABC-type sugar transport system ATPase subunit